MESKVDKLKHKIEDHMLLGSIYDNIMIKTKYRNKKLSFLYNVMVAQKHRMLYYKQFRKKYLNRCTANPVWENQPKVINNDTVWFCWLQGIENAPKLVKRCLESLQRNIPDKKIIIIDSSNLTDYVNLPDYIIEKWKKGIIENAHFTDMVRLELLIQKGGYWIDSTVLCTDSSMLDIIDKQPLFMYSFYYFGFNPEIMELNNWFIKSCTNNNILCLLREFLYTYWKENNRAVNYFMTQLFLTMAVEYYEDEYKKMPVVSQVDAHVLATYIGEPFDADKYQLLKKSTGFHKLSTRFEQELIQAEGCFYDVVIKQGKY